MWNRQGTYKDLADPADISLGHKQVQRWNLPDGWVISRDPAHEALVSEADYIAAQGVGAARGPAPLATVGAGWNPPGPTAGLPTATATAIPAPARLSPGNAFIREDRVLPHLPALHLLLTGADGSEGQRRRRTRRGADARHHASPEDVIAGLRANEVTLTFDPAAGTLHAQGATAIQIVTRKAS